MSRFLLYAHTIRHLDWHQVPARLQLRAMRWVRERIPGIARAARLRRLNAPQPISSPFRLSSNALLEDSDRLNDIPRGRWRFLDQTVDLGLVTDWAAPGQSQLWRYHLHYFDDLPLLVQRGEDGARVARLLVEDWIARVRCGDPLWRDPWHPYVVSLRLVNWLLADAAAPDAFAGSRVFEESLREHSVFAMRNLERDVGGNHLLKNLKAVAVAALYWQTWRSPEDAVDMFAAELERQTLLDGVHYERSPTYHCQVMTDALEVVGLLLATRRAVPGRLAASCATMHDALARLTHPDGDIALLGDSAFGMTASPSELRSLFTVLSGGRPAGTLASRHRLFSALPASTDFPAVPPGSRAHGVGIIPVHAPTHAATHSGILTLAGGGLTVITDVGAACPDELPAHAQADTLSFELSVGRLRMVVDAGVSEYQAGPWREYARSTRAHNTVEVDGYDSTECWGSFRAARRARVRRAERGVHESWQWVEAVHDGYARLTPPVDHHRCVALHGDGVLLVHDRLTGLGTHTWALHIHLHPDVRVDRLPTGMRLRRGDVALRVTWAGLPAPVIVEASAEPVQGWYSERFGERRPAPVLTWSAAGSLPAAFTVALAAEPLEAPFASFELENDRRALRVDGRLYDGALTGGRLGR